MELFSQIYEYLLLIMSILGVGVFITLQFVTPAYGMTFNNRWGISIRSNLGWFIMEAPVFFSMFIIYFISLYYNIRPFNIVTFVMFFFLNSTISNGRLSFPC